MQKPLSRKVFWQLKHVPQLKKQKHFSVNGKVRSRVVVYPVSFVTAPAKMSINVKSISLRVIQQVVQPRAAASVNIRQSFLFGEKLSMRIKVVRTKFLPTKKSAVLFQQ